MSRSFRIRAVTQADAIAVKNLLAFEGCVHRHLDWREPQDWIGFPPYFILESIDSAEQTSSKTNRKPLDMELAVLACPPDPGEVAWIRLFAFLPTLIRSRDAWSMLWEPVRNALIAAHVRVSAALVADRPWMEDNLLSSGFEHTHNVVSLLWEDTQPPPLRRLEGIQIRAMQEEDIPQVFAVDKACFPVLWQYSAATLRLAFRTARYASLALHNDLVVAYQITSMSTLSSHLSRLAVLPDFQGRGFGYALTQEMLQKMIRENIDTVTVNTQDYNYASLTLYHHLGFREDGYSFPVYELPIMEESG